jgi:hypothetical protein
MLVRIEPLLSFIAAPQGFGSIGATTILTQGGIETDSVYSTQTQSFASPQQRSYDSASLKSP